jgi:subtilisin family serine protease
MHRTFLRSLALVALTAAVAGAQERQIVVFKPGVNPDRAAQALGQQHGFAPGYVYRHAVRGMVVPGNLGGPKLARIRADRRVAYMEADQVFRANQVTTHVARSRADVALDLAGNPDPVTVSGVTVAILDTGIMPHPDLNIDEAAGVRFYNRGPMNVFMDTSPTGWHDGDGHGTHCAGIVGAKDDGVNADGLEVVGVAPGVRLIPVKVLGDDGSGYTSGIMAGIDWVVQRGDVDVANMSLGGGFSQALNDSVAGAVAAGVTMAVAAGNDSADASNYSPASEPTALTVAALTDTDGQPGGIGPDSSWALRGYDDADDARAWFSNFGSVVDVIAPGTDILSTWNDGAYYSISGTSMATPYVVGAVALAMSAHPGLKGRPALVRDHLVATGWAPTADEGYVDWAVPPLNGPEPLVDVANAVATAPDLPPVTYDELTISPSHPQVEVGQSQQFAATAVYSDRSEDVTADADAIWEIVGDAGVASLAGPGLVSGDGEGTVTVTVTFNGRSASTTLRVVAPPPPSDDTITVSKATYNSRKQELVVEATTTSSSTPLKVTYAGSTYDMSFSKGKWVHRARNLASKPTTVRVATQNDSVWADAEVGGK